MTEDRLIFGNRESRNIFIQPVDEHDLELMEDEVSEARKNAADDFCLIAYCVNDWFSDLSPWYTEPVFGKENLAGHIDVAYDEVISILNEIPKNFRAANKKIYLIGYSLAGLFALWMAGKCDIFAGIAAVSPSVWYPGWIDYAKEKPLMCDNVYLSLGRKEEKARNKIMAAVGDCIRTQYDILKEHGKNCILEWNEGNHFVDSDKRCAKGIEWLLNQKGENI